MNNEQSETWIWPPDDNAIIVVAEVYDIVGNIYWVAWPTCNPNWQKTGHTKEEAVGKVFLDMADLEADEDDS